MLNNDTATPQPGNPEPSASTVTYLKFTNGRIWRAEGARIRAFVWLDNDEISSDDMGGFERFLDALAEGAIDSVLLSDFTYGIVAHTADAVLFEVEGGISDLSEIGDRYDAVSRDEHLKFLASFFNWSSEELLHADQSADDEPLPDECIVPLANGRALHTPAYPAQCEYVRVTQAGHELAYWDFAEWRDCPQLVMGALIGCAKGRDS